MKTMSVSVALLSLLAGQIVVAQSAPNQTTPSEAATPVEDFKPAPSNQAGKQYPQVNSEGRARFRIVAPQAQSVARELRAAEQSPSPRAKTARGPARRGRWTKAFITTRSISMGPKFRIPGSRSSTARAAGAARSKFPPRTRTFTR